MTRSRIIFLLVLLALPFAFLMGVGVYHLWETNWLFIAWWPMAACLATAYILAWRWQKAHRRTVHTEPVPMHWTDRDHIAWKRVQEQLKKTDAVTAEQLADPQYYFDVSTKLARELAEVYHPTSSEPLGNVTLPELLSVLELAAHDVGKMANQYFPGGHLLTINHLRQARQAVKIYQHASNAWWTVSAVIDPIQTASRYLATKIGMGKPLDLLKQNVVLWLYALYVQRLGHYLIELYSGRLRIGAERYRELLAEHQAKEQTGDPSEGFPVIVPSKTEKAEQPRPVTIAVVGQVNAGKSSVINALLGEQRAVTDVVPATQGIARYELKARGTGGPLVLLDTPGYAQSELTATQREAIIEAARDADLLLLVVHARNAARKSDQELLTTLEQWFRQHPERKHPPVVVAITHIDLLTPAMEWAPPYQWREPNRTKERQIQSVVEAVRADFGEAIRAIAPVCTDTQKAYGIDTELYPQLVHLLGEARAVSLLRCLHAEADEGQIRRIFDQMYSAGKYLITGIKSKIPS